MADEPKVIIHLASVTYHVSSKDVTSDKQVTKLGSTLMMATDDSFSWRQFR